MGRYAKTIDMFTDGACSGNPGPGGYGVILRFCGKEKEMSGGEADTTNNRMELMAVIAGLAALKESCNINLYTDSKYVADAIQKGWAVGWRKKGWKKADNSPALNSDLWQQALDLLEKHDMTIHWVKGHDGHPENERCDTLAVEQSQKYKSQINN